jgi:hypothetical protein
MDRAVVPFRHWHMAWLLAAGEPEGGRTEFGDSTLQVLETQNSWTGVVDGEPVACGGTIEQWKGRHIAWTCMNPRSGRHMSFITRAVLRNLETIEGRIELTVRRDFEQGHRWARILGFEIENPPGVLLAYGPLGEDHVGYVRFNKR